MSLKEDVLFPGDRVFCDQYESSVLGRKWETYGKEKKHERYRGGTLFCGGASTYITINHQSSLRTGDTLQGKHSFEDFASSVGVNIKEYRGDNHIFNSVEYLADCNDLAQKMTFCGTGAHHQNQAERAIQTVVRWARTLLVDAAIHWPDEVDLNLWPMAMDHAVWVWNHLSKQHVGLSPLELFTSVRSDHSSLNRLYIWGYPGYVLKPKLQTNGASIPKWNKRSRLGQFLGFSPNHSTRVAMMRNIATGNISPQFHVVFDDHFETVSTSFQDPTHALDKHFSSTEWQTLLRSSERFFPEDAHPPPLNAEWDDPDNPEPDIEISMRRSRRNFQRQHPLDPSILEDIPTNRERVNDDDISFDSSNRLPSDNIQVSFDLDSSDIIEDDSLESSKMGNLPLMP